MEELFLMVYIAFWSIAALVVAVLLVYLIAKRLEDRKSEDFEKRSN